MQDTFRTDCTAGRQVSYLPTERQSELRTFPQRTLDADLSTHALHDVAHIIEAEAIAFHVVKVALRYTVELVKDIVLLLLFNTNTIICHSNNPIRQTDGDINRAARIFQGIVYEVA